MTIALLAVVIGLQAIILWKVIDIDWSITRLGIRLAMMWVDMDKEQTK